MAKAMRARGADIRAYILDNIGKHPSDIAKISAVHFGISRQAVNKHLQRLAAEKALTLSGNTRNRVYKLRPLLVWEKTYEIGPALAEDQAWSKDAKIALGTLPDSVMNIWHYGFTEIFNNAIDHSGGKSITVLLKKTAANSQIYVSDNGVGIFKKITEAMGLLDERHAILELAKGKLTTDPENHSGEGIFFSSRMFDSFVISSRGISFSHDFGNDEDWVIDTADTQGTVVSMKLNNHTSMTVKKIFDEYSSDDDYGFTRTVVPLRLAQYGNDPLVSRSQAKRVLARVELFKVVVFDFTEVPTIGQAFADEIFRVFKLKHQEIEMIPIKANRKVQQMIERAQSSDIDHLQLFQNTNGNPTG